MSFNNVQLDSLKHIFTFNSFLFEISGFEMGWFLPLLIVNWSLKKYIFPVQSAGAVEYTDYISTEG